MAYHKFYPSAALSPYVYFYYVLEYKQVLEKPLDLQALPKGLGGLVINYSDPYFAANAKQEWEKVPDHFLAGQFIKKYTLRLSGKVGMLGVVFMPAALTHLLGIPMLEFTNQRIDLPLVLGNKTQALAEQVALAATHSERIRVMEHFLLQLFPRSSAETDVIDYALKRIIQWNGVVSIEHLADHLCISNRHFRRRFTEKVGISPKLYARIKRFNYITLLTQNHPTAWAEIVYGAGYHDQAHFIHDLHSFSGKNPGEFVQYHQHLAQLVGA